VDFEGWEIGGSVSKGRWVMHYKHLVSGTEFKLIVNPTEDDKEVTKINKVVRGSIKIIEDAFGKKKKDKKGCGGECRC